MSHIYEDEELKCLVEAREKFKQGLALVDQAMLAKYTALAKQEDDNGDSMDESVVVRG